MNDDVVLVTGASGGIGSAICEAFAEAGATVIGIDRSPSVWTQGDSRDLGDGDLLNKLDERIDFTKLRTIVHSAAVQVFGRLHEVDGSVWNETLSTNVLAINSLVSRFRSQLIANRGSVVVVGSIHSLATREGNGAYSVSKAALDAWVRAVSIELAPKVRVNSVVPGAIASGALRQFFESSPKHASSLQEMIERRTPLGRIGDPRDVADAVFFLASESASFITGQSLVVDGGAMSLLATEVR